MARGPYAVHAKWFAPRSSSSHLSANVRFALLARPGVDPKRTHRRRRSMHNPTVGQVGNPCLPFVRLGSCNRFRFGQASREIRGTKRVGGIQEFCVESCFLNRTIAYKASIPIEFESLNVKAHCGQAPGKSTATSLASSTNRLKTDAAPY